MRSTILWVLICALAVPRIAGSTAPEVSPPSLPVKDPIEQLTEIMVEAPEPRYVSPTRRDQIGRIWAPVMINGRVRVTAPSLNWWRWHWASPRINRRP
jgi:hypothetical protein